MHVLEKVERTREREGGEEEGKCGEEEGKCGERADRQRRDLEGGLRRKRWRDPL